MRWNESAMSGTLRDKIIGLGIDRIDYTKGIPHRIRAINRFFERNPQYIGEVVFIQAGVMSRTNIIAYQQLADQIERLLDDVNSRFGTDNWQPIMYKPTDLPSLTLMALRRLARFCVVSSLHDGMNLVAKEYVASRFDHDGVLILSPFTGAALELTDALIVNPYDIERFAESIREAVEMPQNGAAGAYGQYAGRGTGKQHLQVGCQVVGGYDAGGTTFSPAYPKCLTSRRLHPSTTVAHLLNVWPSVRSKLLAQELSPLTLRL